MTVKTAKPLTPQQMADILFQRPERLTKGVLEQRSPREKLRDRVMIYTDKRSGRDADPGPIERLRGKLFLTFNEEVAVEREEPRSLRKAALELKSLGFTNEQVVGIKEWVYRGQLSMEHSAIIKKQCEIFPGFSVSWCDKAFLGVALYNEDGVTSCTNVFPGEIEPMAYDFFIGFLQDLEKMKPALFTPDHAGKRYAALNPG